MTSFVRRATHAGSSEDAGWYPGDPRTLSSLVGDWFSTVPTWNEAAEKALQLNLSTGRRLIGVIGPHAGVRFSGPTASVAYRSLSQYLGTSAGQRVRRIIMMGPSHRKYIEGVELSQASAYETPNGTLQVDQEAVRGLLAAFGERRVPCAHLSRSTDEQEHSLELHLPFVTHCLTSQKQSLVPHVKLLPMLVGQMSNNQFKALSEALSPLMDSEENLFVISSDFCHWGSRFRYQYHFQPKTYPHVGDAVIAMDHEAIRLLQGRDSKGWASYLEETGNTICGQNPITAVLGMMEACENKRKQKSLFDISFVHYSQSNKLRSTDDSCVSYASALLWGPAS